MSDELAVDEADVSVTCARCGEAAAVNVTGIDATVEVAAGADVTVHRTDRFSVAIHVETDEE